MVLPPREINPRDTRATLQAILRRWLPLSDTVLRMIIRTVPDPITAQQQRLFTLLPEVTEQLTTTASPGKDDLEKSSNSTHIQYSHSNLPIEIALMPRTEEVCEKINASYEAVKECIAQCDNTESAPVVVFVSKMVPVRVAELSQRDFAMMNARLERRAQEHVGAGGGEESSAPVPRLQQDGEVFMALARVFSGTLQRDSSLYILGSKYDPLRGERIVNASSEEQKSVPQSNDSLVGLTRLPADHALGLYIMLGPSVVPVNEVSAGNIVGILGLSDQILKTATLSSTWATYPMTAITFQSKPMLRVAVEPISHVDLRSLECGLQQLHQFDPVVEIGVDKDTGQNTMTCLGELHLEQCVKALTERFAKYDIKFSHISYIF